MFSTPPVNGGTGPAAGTRSSRRRPRPVSSEGSISQPKAKRPRSALTEKTFQPPDGAPEMQEVKTTKSTATVSRREPRHSEAPRRELAVRAKKSKSAERPSKGDGSIVLSSNDTFTVSKLPAWPERLQEDRTVRQQGAIYSDTGYALVLTHSHAIVWPYTTTNASLETFVFALPQPSKHSSDPLPLGSLVSASASSSEPGLVVVMPSTGKVTYWESIASAATLDLIRQQRNGVELWISGMFSGETVVQILNAETAGFLLGFSSGRLAYMSVRDGHGKPDISVHFLRSSGGSVGGGIFGSLRNALSNTSWRGDLAAARASPTMKIGERDIATATSKGRVQLWNLQRSGHNSLTSEVDAREPIMSALKGTDPSLAHLLIESFEVLDLTFVPTPIPSAESEYDDGVPDLHGPQLLLLVSVGDKNTSRYALVQITLTERSLNIGFVRHIKSYTTLMNHDSISKPRLHLPSPAVLAFIVFDRAVILCSVARKPESPESQLLGSIHNATQAFEDVVDFRRDTGAEIVGSGLEEPLSSSHVADDSRSRRHKAKTPAVVLLVKGGGLVRISATDAKKFTLKKEPRVTAKSKLEQAVFFSTVENSPLDFTGRAELQFTAEEVGEAALALSHEILSSTTPYIPSLPVSLEQNLRKRAKCLHILASYIKKSNVRLDRVTKWKLLWDAEKIAGAIASWDQYDASLKEKPVGQKHGLWNEVVEYIHEQSKTEPVPEAGELDPVRHWFIHDIWRLEIAVAWAFQAVKYNIQDGELNHQMILCQVSEADDLVSGALEAAFKYRADNVDLYRLGDEDLENGILYTGYEGLPQFWTSTMFVSDNLKKLTDLARSLVHEYWPPSGKEGSPDAKILDKVRLENVRLVDLSCKSSTERFRWCLGQEDPAIRNQGEHIMNAHLKVREIQIYRLAAIGLVDEAIELAQKHKVFDTLVSLVVEDLQHTIEAKMTIELEGSETKALEERFEYLNGLVDHYYDLFGKDWANALFSYYVKQGQLFELLNDNDEHRHYLTQFLRSKKEFAKVAWINEVTVENDFNRASAALLELGLRRERDLWSKKVELSIGKLSWLAGRAPSDAQESFTELSETKKQLGLIRIQEKIFQHIQPAITAAIDEKAELQLALEVFGSPRLKGKDAFAALLQEKLGWLIDHKAMGSLDLVDLLTLMGSSDDADPPNSISGDEFYLALDALRAGPSDKTEQKLTERVIWRWCMIRDDWAEINNTLIKDDNQVFQQLQQTALFSTLKGCIKQSLSDKSSTFSPVKPQEALGACTEELDARYQDLDASVKDPLLRDMRIENDLLKHYIERCRLEKWFEGAVELAKQSVEAEMNEQVQDGANMKEAAALLQSLEEDIAEKAQEHARKLLQSKPRYKPRVRLNGSVGSKRY